MSAARIRVLIADDHQRFRGALRRLLESDPAIEVIAEVGSGNEVLAVTDRLRPDVVCMDYRMPGLDGIAATRQLITACPELKIIGMSANAESHFASVMCQAGAAGYVAKGDTGARLLRLIHDVLRPTHSHAGPQSAADALTVREREVLQALAEGHGETELAWRLGLTQALVRVHLRNMMRKLGRNSVAELARCAASPARGDRAGD
jgi:two-component system NarL family response regulator